MSSWAYPYVQEGYQGERRALRALLMVARMSIAEAADACLVSPETFRRWIADRPPPRMAVRLMAIHAGYLPWRGFQGFACHQGRLWLPPDHYHGLEPHDLTHLGYWRELGELWLTERQRTAPVGPQPLAALAPSPWPRRSGRDGLRAVDYGDGRRERIPDAADTGEAS